MSYVVDVVLVVEVDEVLVVEVDDVVDVLVLNKY
jgi:hypothetical protein